jgi:hypothetical protein
MAFRGLFSRLYKVNESEEDVMKRLIAVLFVVLGVFAALFVVAGLIVGCSDKPEFNIQETITVFVDYNSPIATGIAAGQYAQSNTDVNDHNFPSSDSGEARLEIILARPNQSMTTTAVLTTLENIGLRAATLQELLAVGERIPGRQYQNQIIALGSIWPHDGVMDVPYLGNYSRVALGPSSCRILDIVSLRQRWSDLSWIDREWQRDVIFAAVAVKK